MAYIWRRLDDRGASVSPEASHDMNIDYWMAVPLIGIALTVPFWLWMWWSARRRPKQ
jgi:hypothetical protein